MHAHMKFYANALNGFWRGALAAMILGAPQVMAAQTLLGSSRDWDAFVVTEGNSRSCYMRAAPGKTAPAGANRGDIFLFVSHRPASKVTGEISVIVGYTFKPGSSASMTIGSQKFSMFTQGDGAWIEKPADEARAVTAMKQGASLTLEGVSSRGTKTTDTYSLQGFSAALSTINKACGVK